MVTFRRGSPATTLMAMSCFSRLEMAWRSRYTMLSRMLYMYSTLAAPKPWWKRPRSALAPWKSHGSAVLIRAALAVSKWHLLSNGSLPVGLLWNTSLCHIWKNRPKWPAVQGVAQDVPPKDDV